MKGSADVSTENEVPGEDRTLVECLFTEAEDLRNEDQTIAAEILEALGEATDRRPEEPPEPPGRIDADECEWCSAPFPEAGAHLVHSFDYSGSLLESAVICSKCNARGPPGGARYERVSAALRSESERSALERLGWFLIRIGE